MVVRHDKPHSSAGKLVGKASVGISTLKRL